jgi:iron(III) transport system substrate-binding protein
VSEISRRQFLHAAGAGAAALALSCGFGDEPETGRSDRDGPDAAGADPSAAGRDWQERWGELVAAAEAEGALSLITVVGRGYTSTIERFEQTFPRIEVTHLGESTASVWLAEAKRRRKAGQEPFDVALVQPERALVEGVPAGMWKPVRPLLLRPDVLEDGAWRDGLDRRFLDAGGQLCLGWEYQVIHAYAVNTDFVRPEEIRSVHDLLNPRWRGRILSLDPRLGTGLLSAASVASSTGNDVVRRLLVDHSPVIFRDNPAGVAEPLARGRYPIAMGVRPKALNPLREQGIGHNVAYLDLPDADFAATNCLFCFEGSAHPAASALFANWVLTQETQTALASTLQTNSARTDVQPFEPDGIATPGAKYYEPDRESNYRQTADTQRFVRELLGAA